MVLLLTLVALAVSLWRGASPLAVGLIAAGFLVQLALVIRLVRLSAGGVGGHAEWVRHSSTRARLRRSPAWLVGLGLVGLGIGLAFWLG